MENRLLRLSTQLTFPYLLTERKRTGKKGKDFLHCPQTHPQYCCQRWLIQASHSTLKGATSVWQQRTKRQSIIVVCRHLSNWQQRRKNAGFTSCSLTDVTRCKINTEIIHISLQRHPTRSPFDWADQMQPFFTRRQTRQWCTVLPHMPTITRCHRCCDLRFPPNKFLYLMFFSVELQKLSFWRSSSFPGNRPGDQTAATHSIFTQETYNLSISLFLNAIIKEA